jgi:cellulose synthase operon protein C
MKLHSVLALALISNLALAQPVPDAGLAAEMQGQWADAVEIYQRALAANPAQAHLWERIADIRATQLKAPERAVEALREAVKYAPDDARLHHKLSQAYAVLQQGPAALAAVTRAVELEPGNLAYLRARADLAAWLGDYDTALDSHQRILAIAPDDAGARLGTARVHYWRSQLDASVRAYRDYLARQPDAAAAWIEYIVVITELGDYARAIELLEDYRQRFGDQAAYRKQKARVLAWAQRPTPSLDLVAGLEPIVGDDYELGYTRTVALHHAHRPREALASIAEVTRLRPDSKETTDLARFVRTPLRSNASVGFGYHAGSDDVSIRHAGLTGEYMINPRTRLFGGADRQWLHADSGSGYEKPDGGTSIGYNRTWLGVRHRASPKVSLDAQVGGGRAEGDSRFIYKVGADLQPTDALALRLAHRQDLFTVSPRSAKLGIERRATTLDATWAPDLRWTVDSRVGYDTLSDGNDRWEAVLAPRRAILRAQRLNLDLGVSGRWFSFDEDPGHGYYAPSLYQRYALTAFTYWKISDDDGVSVAFSYGPYKDNTMSGFDSGGDIVAEGFFGIYRDWYLNVKGGLSNYGGGGTGGYRSQMYEISLTRRF